MTKTWLVPALLSTLCFSSLAVAQAPDFFLLPNMKAQALKITRAGEIANHQIQAINLVKQTLNITADSPYRSIRIRFIYQDHITPQALIIYLLSSKDKSFELVKLNLNDDFTVQSIDKNYRLTPADLSEAPARATPVCPDSKVQFVIGNSFKGDVSVEKEVQTVFHAAQDKGYNPVLLDVNNHNGPQPTINAYENWFSCPNVKGFYNESHGSNEEILLSDGDFTYRMVDNDLVDKLTHDIVLFDSCDTFNDPLLPAMTSAQAGDSQKYIAGIIALPFGSSERTASCVWLAALDQQTVNPKLIKDCANKAGLDPLAFRITGLGKNHLKPAVIS